MDRTILRCLLAANLFPPLLAFSSTVLMQAQSGLPPDVALIDIFYQTFENTPRGTVLFNITAKYSDGHREVGVVVETNSLKYVQVQHVNGSDGVWNVILNTDLDREYLDHIPLQILAEGNVTVPLYTHLFVLDVNDNAPKFENLPYTAEVKENTSVGTTVFTDINATDPDLREGGLVSYSLTPVGSNSSDVFVINSTTGCVILNRTLDYCTRNSFHYLVTATDGGGLSTTSDLIFTILPISSTHPPLCVNENVTEDNLLVFGRVQCNAVLYENKESFNPPLRLEATLGNEQRSNNSNITYRLSSSTIPPGLIGHFHIGPLTGDITVVHPLDFETIPFGADQPGAIRLTAVAKDHERPYLSSTMDFWITLVDINDNIPQFDETEYLSVVPENTAIGSQVIVVHAHDADGSAPNNHVYYFLEGGDRDHFAIDHVTGAITVVGSLDRESVASYWLQVMARDQGANPLHSYCLVYIRLSDINDEPPRFPAKHTVIDDSEIRFSHVYSMTAVDLDLDSHLQYSILWNESYGLSASSEIIPGEELTQWFQVDIESGGIHQKRPLDSTQVTTFVLTLLVQDLNATDPSAQQDTAILTINVRGTSRRRRFSEVNNNNETSYLSTEGRDELRTVVTFSAMLTHDLEVTDAQQVVYNIVFINSGSGYSNRTGIFTCPRAGEYIFQVHTFVARNSSVSLSLYHKVTRVRTFEVHAEDDSKADSVTAVLQLMKDDEVYVMSTPGHTNRLLGFPDAILNSFSGYLQSPASE